MLNIFLRLLLVSTCKGTKDYFLDYFALFGQVLGFDFKLFLKLSLSKDIHH